MSLIMNQNILIKINVLENKMKSLDEKMDLLDYQLKAVIQLLSENKKDCNKMSQHIDFINEIYRSVKAPMEYICDTFNQRLIKK